MIDRIDRHPDGTIEITDYKTGRSKNQEDVDRDDQLSAYALAMASGAVFDPETKEPLPAASQADAVLHGARPGPEHDTHSGAARRIPEAGR